jgi:predicted transposase/invertase (TIGR01784 family)
MLNNEPDKTIEETNETRPATTCLRKRVQLRPEDDPLDITRDPVFKAVLTRDTAESRTALRFLVSAAILQPVTIISVIANEPSIIDTQDRLIRYDIAVKFNDGSLGNIEMTVDPKTYEHRRQEYHLARLFISQDIKGIAHSYADLRPAWQVSILGDNLHRDDALVHQFRYYDREHNLSFNGLTSIIDIELKKAEQFLTKPVPEMTVIERWAVFFRYIQDPTRRDLINEILNYEEGIAMATAELLTVSQDEIMRARLEHELKNQLDWQSGMVEAKRAGYKQAALEYDGKIREKDGKIQALEQQAEQQRLQAAQKLRDLGLIDEQIAATLGPDALGRISG